MLGDVDSHASLSCLDFKALQQLSDGRQRTHGPQNLQDEKTPAALLELEAVESESDISYSPGLGETCATEKGRSIDIHLRPLSQAQQFRDAPKITDRDLLYFCGFIARIQVRCGNPEPRPDVQVISPPHIYKMVPNVPPVRLWLDSPSSAGPADAVELNLLLVRSMATDRQRSMGAVDSILLHIWKFIRGLKVFKYSAGFYGEALSHFAKDRKRLQEKLRSDDLSLTYFVCELLFELVLLIPTIFVGTIVLVVLPFVFVYILYFLLHRVYVTSHRKLDMSSPVVMMLVVEPGAGGTYQRIGMAEWEEDAFVACQPEVREIILA